MGWLSRLFRRRALERELDLELRFHLEAHTEELIGRGRSPEAARREARRALGGIEQVKERARDARGTRWLEEAWQDARFAVRGLRREPGFTAVAVLTLGLGVGAATAIFSVVNPVLFEPLVYPEPERIVTIADRSAEGSSVPVAFGSYRELAERSRSFESLSAFKPWRPAATGQGEPEMLEGQRVGAEYFRVLGVTPALGAGFDPVDDRAGGLGVVVLSDGLWRRRFDGDRDIVGRQVRLDGEPYTVVGVMPREFENVPAPSAQVWSLLQYDASLPSFDGREWGHHLGLVGRLRPQVPTDALRQELDQIAADPVPAFARPAWAAMGHGLLVRDLKDAVTAGVRPVLMALLGAVALLLAIACVNVTNLLLARGAQRRGELAMRTALGAARSRLVRQLLTEGLLLCGLGGALGVVVARLGVGGLVALSPRGLPRADAIGVDGTAFAFAVAVTALVGVVVGLAPILVRSRGDLHRAAGMAAGRTVGSHLATRRALVVAEVALALTLLVGAGLLLRSLQHVFAITPGFDGTDVVVLQMQRLDEERATRRFFAQALDVARQQPEVAAAALTSQLPLSGDQDMYGVEIAGDDRPEGASGAAYRYAVSPGYFETMGIALLRGRLLSDDDVEGAPGAVVINESFARRAFPGRDPIGQRLHVGRTDLPWYTIVGVVGDVKQESLAAEQGDAVYLTPAQWYFADRAVWLVARAAGDPESLVAAIKSAVWSVDGDQPIARVDTMRDLLSRSEARRRFALIVLQAFALLALVLAGVGLFGVLSGNVTERRREIGVRSALGASRQRIVAMVVGQGMALTGLGVAVGLAGAAAASGALASLLFGVSRLDVITYAGVVAILAAVSAVACWIPATRAARVDPVTTLRAD